MTRYRGCKNAFNKMHIGCHTKQGCDIFCAEFIEDIPAMGNCTVDVSLVVGEPAKPKHC